jgi:uroporphyrinogen III methyltransferase/synthase
MNGTVYLVGAGPGDAGLVGERALEVLSVADVVVHDRLMPRELLAHVPESCTVIDAGKRAGEHTLPQEEINRLLVRSALQDKIVVRLKGGDPFLFGRGGEEALACLEQDVAFEIIPGVTSALAAPAYAGIPVTHRDFADSVTIVTARTSGDLDTDPDYGWLARCPGTLLFLMGLSRLSRIATKLVERGMDADTPAAVISHGTQPTQRTVVGTLSNITELANDAELTSPGIVVVGEVVKLRDKLMWFERRPLFGRTIAVTRARAQASELSGTLTDLGATVVECPVIECVPLPSASLDAQIDLLRTKDWVIFTSQNGATTFFNRLSERGLDARALGGLRIAVVGPGTAHILEERGIVPDVVPPVGLRTAAGLLETLSGEPLYGASVLLVRGELGDESLPAGLRSRGASVTMVPVYRTEASTPAPSVVDDALRADVVIFTAGSTVRNFVEYVSRGEPTPPAISIGPRTSEAAAAADIQVAREANDPGIDGVVEAVLDFLSSPVA